MKRFLTPEEKKLWREVTRHDTPLKAVKEEAEAEPAPPPARKISIRPPSPDRPVSAGKPQPDLAPGVYAGLDGSSAERLRKGRYPIDAVLDLHGMNREKAYRALCDFIRLHHELGHRCLLVITGKGKPPQEKDMHSEPPAGILRTLLPQWLAGPLLSPAILVFDTAQPKHGGSGAYYILLRRTR